MTRVVVVDGANVVGSRPEGWWKDRAGAAARLHARLLGADLDGADIVLVLEGRARPGVAAGVVEGGEGRVRTVHAPGEGDDEIVRQAAEATAVGHDVVVVTADRGLRERVEVLGASTVGPSWLPDG